jgi:DNA gyrase subunit B/topoisomerase-4 subunit B
VLNVEQASTEKVLNNAELKNIVTALGCGLGDDYDENKLRYGKIFILTDADSDGHHISTLLLTFFYRHLRKLIENGHVYLALPPLYKIEWGKERFWVLDDAQKELLLKKAPKNAKPEISRFKGLGEMMPDDLKATTLDPKKRSALRVVVENALETDRIMNELMGKDASARFRFIMERAADAKDIDV